ncbi:MAG TPA: hypothetical protein VE988_25120 [Gemmataceae bacterium]|nr:hypothetical protein [Gemmataceae bacterium]
MPALDALREAAKKGSSPEARERAALIEKTIRTKHRLPTIENGMEFQFKMEVGSATADYVRISFSLKITNTAAMPYQIYARGAVKPVFLDAKGKNLAEKARKMSPKKGPGSGTSNAPLSSPNLWPKGSFDMDFGTYRVLGMPGDSVELSDSWGVSGRPTESMVPPGDYQVGLIYENKLQQEPKAQAGNWLWVGRAVTLTEPLTVKPIAPK